MRSRITLSLALALAIGLGGLFAGQRGWVAPLRNAVIGAFTPVQSGISQLKIDEAEPARSAAYLQTENEQLRIAVERLNAEVIRLRELDLENRRLIDEREYRQANPDLEFLSARVIGYDPTSIVRSIQIDKGASNGVSEGMAVVNSAGLVGRVVQVAPNWSKVLLIVDASSSVNGMLQRSESCAAGVVFGQNDGQLVMRYLPQDEEIEVGEAVVTSGLGGGFPKGLFIGLVSEVRHHDVDLFQEVTVTPAVRFSRLENVLLIMNFTPLKLD